MSAIPFVGKPEGGSPNASENTVGWLEEVYRACDGARRGYEPDWVDNIHMLEGRHWEKAADDIRRGRKLPVRAPAVNDRTQHTANWIFSLARQAAAGIVDNLGEQIAVPATMDPEDVEAGEVATDFLSFRLEQDGEAAKKGLRFREILWTMVCGQALRFTDWDPRKDSVGFVEALRKRVQLSGAGDISTITLNPWRYHLPPWCEDASKAEFIIVSDVRSVQEINDLYPGKDVSEEKVAVGLGMVQGLVGQSSLGNGTSGDVPPRKQAVILKRMYVAPTPKRPRGTLYVWANAVLLQKGELPDGMMPFVVLEWFYLPGRLYPLPFVTPLRDPQRQYDITVSQLIDLKTRQLRGDLVVHGAVNEDDVVQDVDPDTGWKRIRVAPHVQGFELLTYDLRIQEAEMLLARCWNDGQQLAGVRDPSLGAAPAGVKTATGLALLKESDMQGLTLFRAGFEDAYSLVARQKLLLAQNHYKVPRLVSVTGQSNQPKVRSFIGADLRNTEDVKTRPRPAVTEMQKAQIVSDLDARGAYGPYANFGHMRAMMYAILNSPLPNAQEIVDELCAPLTWEQVKQAGGQFTVMAGTAQMAMLQTNLQPAGATAQEMGAEVA